jgi:hypothetical protein
LHPKILCIRYPGRARGNLLVQGDKNSAGVGLANEQNGDGALAKAGCRLKSGRTIAVSHRYSRSEVFCYIARSRFRMPSLLVETVTSFPLGFVKFTSVVKTVSLQIGADVLR